MTENTTPTPTDSPLQTSIKTPVKWMSAEDLKLLIEIDDWEVEQGEYFNRDAYLNTMPNHAAWTTAKGRIYWLDRYGFITTLKMGDLTLTRAGLEAIGRVTPRTR